MRLQSHLWYNPAVTDRNAVVVGILSVVTALGTAFVASASPGTVPGPLAWLGMTVPLLLYLSFSLPAWRSLRAGPLRADAACLALPAALVLWHAAFSRLAGSFSWTAEALLAVWLAAATGVLWLGKRRGGGWAWGLAGLGALWLPFELGGLGRLALPGPSGMDIVPLLALDAGLFLYLVFWELDGVGFDFALGWSEVREALKQFALLAVPLAALGLALGFIAWIPASAPLPVLLLRPLGIYFLNALPEEFLFRGVMHNLLSRRVPERWCLALSSVVFGLSHVNNGAFPNWKYVLMATVAGWFYGRAYMKTGKVTASALVHTLVNWTWVSFLINW